MHELSAVPPRDAPSTREAAGEREGRGRWASLGAVLAALGASLCCIGPLLFVTFGVGAGLASTFAPLRPLFTALTVLGLAIGHYTVYGRNRETQAADARCASRHACAVPRSGAREKVILWTATLLAIVIWSFSYWSIVLI